MTDDERDYIETLARRLGRLERAVALQAGIVEGLEGVAPLSPRVLEIIQGKHDESR